MPERPQLTWRKSSYSNSNNACLEVTHLPTGQAIRDSKNPTGPTVATTTNQWTTFIKAIHH